MNVFTVHPSTAIKSIADLVAYAKANPGRLPTAIGGVGSSNHITPVWFASIAGLDMLYVPFKGSGDSITALLSAQVLFFVDNEPSILPQIKSGKVRPLAVTGPRRSVFFPRFRPWRRSATRVSSSSPGTVSGRSPSRSARVVENQRSSAAIFPRPAGSRVTDAAWLRHLDSARRACRRRPETVPGLDDETL